MDATMQAEIRLGDRAMQLLGSDIGEYLTGCARQEIDEAAHHVLHVADASDEKEIRRYQDKARRAILAIEWLNEIIVRRDTNLSIIESEDD